MEPKRWSSIPRPRCGFFGLSARRTCSHPGHASFGCEYKTVIDVLESEVWFGGLFDLKFSRKAQAVGVSISTMTTVRPSWASAVSSWGDDVVRYTSAPRNVAAARASRASRLSVG